MVDERCCLQAVEVMTRICGESEASLDYYSLFRAIMKRTPQPMSPLESLASSAVRTAHKVRRSSTLELTLIPGMGLVQEATSRIIVDACHKSALSHGHLQWDLFSHGHAASVPSA